MSEYRFATTQTGATVMVGICEDCGKHSTVLLRKNPKGERGIFVCESCLEKAGVKPKEEVLAITDAITGRKVH